MLLRPHIETPHESYQRRTRVQREAARYYARYRREFAEVSRGLEVWLRGPRCVDCQESDPVDRNAMPATPARETECEAREFECRGLSCTTSTDEAVQTIGQSGDPRPHETSFHG
jgi:hypothetical protein